MSTPEQVEAVLVELTDRLDDVDPAMLRAVLPDKRTVEAYFTDLEVSFHTTFNAGIPDQIVRGSPDGRADIRLEGTSTDLLAMVNGDLRFRRAYATGRVKVEASLADMLRFATVVPPR